MSFEPQHIEDYLLGRLDEDERAAFQFALMRDKNLRREVEAMRILQKMAKAKQNKRRSLFFFSSKRLLRVAAVFIGLTTLAVLIALYNNQQKELPIVNDEKNSPVEQKEDFNDHQLVEDEELKNPQPAIKDSTQSEIVKTPPSESENKLPPKSQKKYPPKEKYIPDVPDEEIVISPIDSFSILEPNQKNIRPEELASIENPATEPELTFRDSFQYEILVGGMDVASVSVGLAEFEGNQIDIGYAPENYYVARLPKYPNGIYFNFSSFYPVSKKSKRSEVEANIKVNPTIEKKYQELGSENFPAKLIGREDTTSNSSLECYCGVLGERYDSLNYIFKIYTNKETDFFSDNYITKQGCLEQHRISFTFSEFPLGLYYIVFFNEETGETVAVDKFEIVQEDENGDVKGERITKNENTLTTKIATSEDLLPNPFLEEIINTSSVENETGIEISTDPIYTYALGEITAGISLVSKKENYPKIRFKLFTNKIFDFENDLPLINTPIDLNRYKNNFLIEEGLNKLHCPIYSNLKVGVYYIVVESENGEQILAVEKFEVRDQ